MENTKQVTATPEENSTGRIDDSQVWSRSCTTAAQSQEQEQQKASADTPGVSRPKRKAAYPTRGLAASAQDPVMRSFDKVEALLQTQVSVSRRMSPSQIDVGGGQPVCPAMREACNVQKEQSGGDLQPPACADVEVLRDAARMQPSASTQQANTQQQRPLSGPKQQQPLFVRIPWEHPETS